MNSAFEVVAEPNRRRILELLCERERPVGDLVHELALSQPAVSKHLRVLRDAGVVYVRRGAAATASLPPRARASRRDRRLAHTLSGGLGAPPRRRSKPTSTRWRTDDRAELGTVAARGDGYVVRFERHLAPSPREGVAGVDRVGAPRGTGCRATSWASAGPVLTIELPFWPEHVERYGIETPTLDGRIVVWDPPAVFEWWWATDRLRWELDEVDGGTRVPRFTTWLGPDGKGAANTVGRLPRVPRQSRDPARHRARHRRWSTPTRRPWRCATKPRSRRRERPPRVGG